jgi:hypothetical protein
VGATGGPVGIQVEYKTKDQNALLTLFEEPWNGNLEQKPWQVGAGADIQTVKIGEVTAEYVKGAYDVLASMTVIVYFIPYLYVFAAMIKLQSQPAGPEVIRVPGGKPVAVLISVIGLLTTTATILLSVVPPADDPNKPLAVLKIVGGTAALMAAGGWIYWAGKKKVAGSS